MPLSRALPAAIAVALFAGCQGGSSPVSIGNPTAAQSGLTAPPEYSLVAGTESLVAAFHVQVNLDTLQADVTPIRGAQTQPPQAISYDLDIANFLRPDSFEITRIGRDPDGDISIEYVHRHPFAAPDLGAAITGKNRADLGYTGRLMVLATAGARSYFGGAVQCDPSFVKNADGYYNVGDLLATVGTGINTFPYKLLVDEAINNRVGVSNFEQPIGNYNPAGGGWQASNIGNQGNEWTGFDYLHGGQAAENSIVLYKDALVGVDAGFDVAVLIKYTDPRGQGGKTRRFPAIPADSLLFAYRLPYSALDASKIELTGTPYSIGTTAGSSETISFDLRDWDSVLTEAADADLSDEPDVLLIEPGASGTPTAELSAPFLSASPILILPTGNGNGMPGEELEYSALVVNNLGTAPASFETALLRVIDPSDAVDDSAYHKGVDPNTIVPDATRALRERTYQAVPIVLGAPAGVPAITVVSPTGPIGCNGTVVSFSATATNLPTSWSWNFGGGASPNTSTSPNPTVTLLGAGNYNGTVTASNAAGSSPAFPFSYTVGTGAGGWQTHLIDPLPSASNGWFPDVEIYGLNPVVSSLDYIGGTWNLMFSSSNVAAPSSAANWTTHMIAACGVATPGSTADSHPVYQAMINDNGRLAIVFNDATTDRVMIAIANVTAPALPTSAASWTIYVLDPTRVAGSMTHGITLHNNRIAVTYKDETTDQCRLALATVDPPMTAGDWDLILVEATASTGLWSDVISYDDGLPGGNKLYVAHRDTGSFNPHITRCLVGTPTAPGNPAEWSGYTMDPDFGGRANSLTRVIRAGQPRLCYATLCWTDNPPSYRSAPYLMFSNVQAPLTAGDWTRIPLDIFTEGNISQMNGTDVITIGSTLYLAYYANGVGSGNGGVLGIAKSLNTNFDTAADFVVTFPDNTGNKTGNFPKLVGLSTGKMAVVHRYGGFDTVAGSGWGMKFGYDPCN